MNIDEWIGITTPKGEKINVNIFFTGDDPDNEIAIHFYGVETDVNGDVQNGEHFDSIVIDEMVNQLVQSKMELGE
jgi:hypothetical protein